MKIVLIAAMTFISSLTFAEGSISLREAIEKVGASNPPLAKALSKLSLAEQGEAFRTREGERVLPFTFKAQNGELTVIIANDQGKLTAIIQ